MSNGHAVDFLRKVGHEGTVALQHEVFWLRASGPNRQTSFPPQNNIAAARTQGARSFPAQPDFLCAGAP